MLVYNAGERLRLASLSDGIVDPASSGTLKANGLVAIEHISDISSCLW